MATPYFEILKDADVSITTTRDIVYTSNSISLIINENAKFAVKTNTDFLGVIVTKQLVFLLIKRVIFLLFIVRLMELMPPFPVEVPST